MIIDKRKDIEYNRIVDQYNITACQFFLFDTEDGLLNALNFAYMDLSKEYNKDLKVIYTNIFTMKDIK